MTRHTTDGLYIQGNDTFRIVKILSEWNPKSIPKNQRRESVKRVQALVEIVRSKTLKPGTKVTRHFDIDTREKK
jgi:hypothetical protein